MNLISCTTIRGFLIAAICCLGLAAQAQDAGSDAPYGGELRRTEERLKKPWYERLFVKEAQVPVKPPSSVEPLGATAIAVERLPLMQNGRFLVRRITINGDRAFFFSVPSAKYPGLTVAQRLRMDLIGKYVTPEEVTALCKDYTDNEFIAQKYLLAYLRYPGAPITDGVLTLRAITGKFGKTRFLTYDYASAELLSDDELAKLETREGEAFGSTEQSAEGLMLYEGKYFSESQLRDRMSFEEFDTFDYKRLYSDVYRLNRSPDLNMKTQLRVVTDADTEEKFVDSDFIVQETAPIHGSVGLENSTSQDNGDWIATASFQHLNLTKNWDVLALDFRSSLDGTLQSAGASYVYPFAWRNSRLTVYTGASNLDVQNITPSVDAQGDGWFAGLQYQFELFSNADRTLELSSSYTYRYSQSQTLIGTTQFETHVTSAPLSLGLNYAELTPDPLLGLNFAGISYSYNHSGGLGSDDDLDFTTFKAGTEADYAIVRANYTRVQQVSDPVEDFGRFLLYMRANGQYSSNPLISAEQHSIGGHGSVRGYAINTFSGDQGVTSSLELRTPSYNRGVFSEPPTDEERKSAAYERPPEGVSLLLFTDYGYIRNENQTVGTQRDASLWSAGLGTRVQLGNRFEMGLDYGYRLNQHEDISEDKDQSGRFHFSMRVIF